MFGRRPATVVETAIDRDDTTAIMTSLMLVHAKLDDLRELLLEDEDGEETD